MELLNYVKKLNLKFEVDVLNSADAILTTVGNRYKTILKDKLSNTKKIYKIYNGYDKIAYDNVEEIKPDSYNIVFTGILSKNHNYQLFYEVLSLLKDNYKDLNTIYNI